MTDEQQWVSRIMTMFGIVPAAFEQQYVRHERYRSEQTDQDDHFLQE
jgi:hypothetical protein